MDDLKFDVLEPVRAEGTANSLAGDIENLLDFDAPLTPIPAHTTPEPAVIPEEPIRDSEPEPEHPSNPVSIAASYCDVRTLFNLSSVSREVRLAATADSVWKPICHELGVTDKTFDPNDLVSLASPFNVLDLGYSSGELSAYTTFCRAYRLLRPLVADPRHLVSPQGQQVPLSHMDKAQLLTSAMKLCNVLEESNDVSDSELQALRAVIVEEKDELRDELSRAIDKEEPLGPLLAAYDIWWQRLGYDDMRQEAVDIYYAKHAIELDAEDAFSFDSSSDSKTVSPRKLSMAFQALASYFNGSRRTLGDKNSGIPSGWLGFMRSVFFDKFTRLVSDYAGSVLHSAEEVSVQEYLNTVPKVYTASRSLLEDGVLESTDEWGGGDLKEMLNAHFLDNMVDDFCERQMRYFEEYAGERVQNWTDTISERESETERFIWSSVPRKRDKTNFVTAFKWAVSSLNMQDDQNTIDHGMEMSATEALSTPQTEFEAQTAVLVSKFRGMESLVSLELVINIMETCRAALHRFKAVKKEVPSLFEPMFVTLVNVVGRQHIKHAFDKAIKVLNAYDPKRFGRLVISMEGNEEDSKAAKKSGGVVEPLVIFTELVNVGDIVQQMIHVFFEEELVSTRVVRKSNFGAPSVTSKRKFEQMLDDMLAEGLSRGIDVLMDQVEFTLVTEQLGSDYLPVPTQEVNLGPTAAAVKVIDLVRSHLDLLRDSTEKTLFDVFQQEVGMRLFTALTKHIKSQTVSVDGAVALISDINAYYAFMLTLKQKALYPYYEALKQVAQLYLVDTSNAKQLGLAVSDVSRYNGVIPTEELVEFLKRRQDWPLVRGKVERVLYGVFECTIC